MIRSFAVLVFVSSVAACSAATEEPPSPAPMALGEGAPVAEPEESPPADDDTFEAATDVVENSDDLPADEPAEPAPANGFAGVAPSTPNPLAGVVGFAQINLTSAAGSCGSHASAIAAAKLRGITSASVARDIEAMIYGYAGMRSRPGIATVAAAVNRYLSYRSVPWKAVVFHSSSSVAAYLAKGSPVIVNTSQWGGHYVTIYGLKSGTVYFSDGTFNDGVSASLPTGYLKKWSWSTFLNYSKGNYVGFVRK